MFSGSKNSYASFFDVACTSHTSRSLGLYEDCAVLCMSMNHEDISTRDFPSRFDGPPPPPDCADIEYEVYGDLSIILYPKPYSI